MRLFSNLKFSISYFAALALSLLLTVLLLVTPVFRDFSYEFGVVYSLYQLIFISIYLRANRGNILSDKFKRNNYFTLLCAVNIIPPIIAGFFIIPQFGWNCWLQGIKFFLYTAVPSSVIATGISFYCLSISKKYSLLLNTFFVFAIIILNLWELYSNPQIYSFNPLFGFYPGVIYDEYLPLNAKHIIYRLSNLIFFMLPILFFRLSSISTQYKSLMKAVFLIVGIIFFLMSPIFGFSTSTSNLEKYLSHKVSTAHFDIYTAPNSISGDEQIFIQNLHEQYFNELSSYFNVAPSRKIKSYIFPNSEIKYQLIGAGNADIARIWSDEIFLTVDDYSSSLKHETAHIFSGYFGSGFLRLPSSLNYSLIEGTAAAADGMVADEEIDSLTRIYLSSNKSFSVNRMFNGINFFSSNTLGAYAASGSFIKYMIDSFGVEKFKSWYRSGYSTANYPRSIEDNFKYFEASTRLLNKTICESKANYYFGSLPFLYKRFPRFLASEYHIIDSLTAGGEFDNALKHINILGKFTNEPQLLLRKINILSARQEYSNSIALLDSSMKQFSNSPYLCKLLIKLGDLYYLSGSKDNALSYYSKAELNSPTESYKRNSALRIELASNNSLLEYLRNSNSNKVTVLQKFLLNTNSNNAILALCELTNYYSLNYSESLPKYLLTLNLSDLSMQEYEYLIIYALKHSDINSANVLFDATSKSIKCSNNPRFSRIQRLVSFFN